jgi:hypothetical protein
MTKRNPDYEMDLMRRGLRDLAGLSPAGRSRVLAYWSARAEAMPAVADAHGEQQLDIEDVAIVPQRVRGAAA